MTPRKLVLLGLLCCAVLIGGTGRSQSVDESLQTGRREANLRLATTVTTYLDGTTAVIAASEVRQGRDLNGDGDQIDVVLHVFDATSGKLRNLGLSIGSDPTGEPSFFFATPLEDRVFAFTATEESGDLNGDGDTDDQVVHVYDTKRDSLVNLRVATDTGLVFFDGRHLSFLVGEALQGQRDLNRDGDTADTVLHTFDSLTGRLQNTALAVASFDFAINMEFTPQELVTDPIVFTVGEQEQGGVDLNGDGDATDPRVLHVLDNGRVRNLSLDLASPFFFFAPESGAGVVLAAVSKVDDPIDDDLFRAVLQVVDISSGRVTDTGLVLDSASASVPLLDRERGLALISIREAAQGTDLNGDGKIAGSALQLITTRTGRVRNLAMDARAVFAAKGRAVILRPEFDAAMDLNNDGDQQDTILTIGDLDGAMPRFVNTRLAIANNVDGGFFDPVPVQMRDGLLTFLVPETNQGGRDLNADGDATDLVLHFADLSTFTTLNSKLDGLFAYRSVEAPLLPLSSGRAVVPVLESRQGNRDLNRDGDTNDMVLQIFDLRSGTTFNPGQAVSVEPFFPFPAPLSIRGQSFVAFLAPENGVDLNGDGDTVDQVHHLLDTATGTVTNLRVAALAQVPLNRSELGFSFAGLTDTFGFEPEIIFGTWLTGFRRNTDSPGQGDAFTFLVSEAAQGNVDLNGDGDTDDVVVHAARVSDRDRNGRLDFAETP